jgi:uncharacterized protein
MKQLFLTLTLIFSAFMIAQDNKIIHPQVSVSGEGKIMVTPDIAVIEFGIQNSGKDAKEVKTMNDLIIEKMIKYIKKFNIPSTDYQTSQLSLYKNYDYEKKKNTFQASQTISVSIKDLSKYNAFMTDVTDTGINNINGVTFKSSKMEELESQARTKAILNAKKKAEDFAGALNQKIGKAILISDTSVQNMPQVAYSRMEMKAMAMDASAPTETMAVGQLEIIVKVNASFILD